MLSPFKEKSWSILLVRGYVLDDQVRALQCENCKSITHVLTANFGNPNLILFGCTEAKCRHRLLRLDFDDAACLMPEALKFKGN